MAAAQTKGHEEAKHTGMQEKKQTENNSQKQDICIGYYMIHQVRENPSRSSQSLRKYVTFHMFWISSPFSLSHKRAIVCSVEFGIV